jgi:hypothetical protein
MDRAETELVNAPMTKMRKMRKMRSMRTMRTMRMLRGIAPAAALAAFLAGCSEVKALQYTMGMKGPPPPAQPHAAAAPEGTVALQPLAPVRRDIFTRSYRIGEAYTVRTGEPVVSVKNYSVTERVGRATALRNFAQTCASGWRRDRIEACGNAPLSKVRGTMGNVFDVPAAVTLPDGQYFAVAMPTDGVSQVYLLVDPTGRLRRGAYVVWREDLTPGSTLGYVPIVELEPDRAIDSSQPLFSFESIEKFVFMGPGYLSFDLIFTGTRENSRGELMTFNYREFGRESTDRPTFERGLQFRTSQKVIEIEKLQIEVQPYGYNELRFRVIADGQPQAPAR